jgi:hypothetical protein
MRSLLVLVGLSLPALALADPCSSGSNVSLTDTTTASAVEQAQENSANGANSTSSSSSSSQSAGGTDDGVRNHYPH